MEIAIIGGGITGLTSALALHKHGIASTVYERAPALNEIGAGVWLQPNAMQILTWLGLETEIKNAGQVLDKMEITNSGLTPIKAIKDAVVKDAHGNQTVAIHRGKLQRVLHNAFSAVGKIELGMELEALSQQNDHVSLSFSGGKRNAEIVLGADGIRSNVRAELGFASKYRSTGQQCWRAIVPFALPAHLKRKGKEAWGRKMRFGFSEVANGQVYFFAVANKGLCPADAAPAQLAQCFAHFDPVVPELINSAQQLHTAELQDLQRLPSWHSNNVCLLGDAAHATTPNMGQGACQGMEDAYYISQLLAASKHSAASAFATFEASRRKKVDYVVNNSWRFGNLAHNPIGQSLLRLIMKATPERVLSKQMTAIYAVEPLA